MYSELFQQLGLSKNESQIYETLITYGELSVGRLSVKAKIHRRNVYDSIHRLLEKGLVFEILDSRESRYQAVEPSKLLELVREKEQMLLSVMPKLEELYKALAYDQAVFIYRGVEGWKNYMRDIIRVGEEFYCIAGKGAWMDARLKNFFPQFYKETQRKKIAMNHLFDNEVKESKHEIIKYVGEKYKFFPQGYSTPCSVDLFGDRVNIVSGVELGGVEEDMTFSVIVNQQVADAFRVWFRFMWDFCPS